MKRFPLVVVMLPEVFYCRRITARNNRYVVKDQQNTCCRKKVKADKRGFAMSGMVYASYVISD